MKKRYVLFGTLVGMVVLFIALEAEELLTYNDNIWPIVEESCFSCHEKNWAHDYETMMAAVSETDNSLGVPLVNPANSDSSVIIWRLHGETPSGGYLNRMPRLAPAFEEEKINFIKTWIEQGALKEISVSVDEITPWSEIKRKYR